MSTLKFNKKNNTGKGIMFMNRVIVLFLLFCCGINQSLLSQNSLTEKYPLMPWPKQIKENTSKFIINNNLTISVHGDAPSRVHNAAVRFIRRLSNRTGIFIDNGFPIADSIKNSATIEIHFDNSPELSIETDESYGLDVTSEKIVIKAVTDIGAMRALETLLQLVNNNSSEYYFPGVNIQDSPRFVWRGLMIDVARHFQPIDVIKRNLDAMAAVKMNVFHWHLTDDQGFRVTSEIYPKLQELASDGLYYTHSQIKDIVQYASNLGIRVVPEFDVPGHASALLTAYPELGSKNSYPYEIERNAGVFDPTLDPTNDETYVFLENLFTEIAPLFPDAYFHIGGDENEGKHWSENHAIQAFKTKHNLDTNHDLQTYFNIKLEKILNKLGKNLMGWDEIMTPNMPTTAVIHSWRGPNEGLSKGGSLIDAARAGYNTVLSNGFYIDRNLSVEHHYSIDPIGNIQLTKDERERILGGEATMWSELVTPLTIDSRIWPRTAAIAERLWSQQEVNDVDAMLSRLQVVSFRLEEHGLTHLKNRNVILRNITHNQDITSLVTLSKVCEPLKMYSRNKGGTEYKSFSPFTLFADACVVDAQDAVPFNKEVHQFVNNKGGNSDVIESYLSTWGRNHESFLELSESPITQTLSPLSENLSNVSNLIVTALQNKKITKNDLSVCNNLMNTLKEPVADVELAIIEALNKLINFCEENYLNQ
jgi:hexosaminidase